MASSLPAALSSQLDVPLTGFSAAVVRRSAQTLQNLLQTRFCCEAQVLGLDLDSDRESPAARPHMVPEKRLESLLPSGVKVSVWCADLANFKAEAIVNAANSRLKHHGGLAWALSEAGGPQVQQESDNYIYRYGSVKSGDAVALGPGKLKCKTIIHAVGPYLPYQYNSHQFSGAKNQLERAVLSVLKIVEGKQLDTVAIPAISSGIFNFPVDQCADIIVNTVQKFYESSQSHRFKPKEVLLVNNDDHTVTKMERACMKLLPRPVVYNQATSEGNTTHTSASTLYSHVAASGTTPQTSASGAQTRGKGGTQPHEVQLGPVRVLLRKGCLEEQKMDVIVNTIGADRQLDVGQVSKTLLKKAGSQMQQEINGAQLRGALYITRGYNLDCKEVYHICCPYKYMSGSDKTLFRAVQDSLWLAVAAQHRSIAFPAIGTGNLGFRDREAAQIMMNAVWDFAPKSPLPLDVHFVIFPSDSHRFKAFEAELNCLRPKAFQMEPSQSSGEAAHSLSTNPALPSPHEQGRAATAEPCLRLQSHSQRRAAEAETWLRALLHKQFNTVCISNNFIQLLGESELEELSQTQAEGVQVEEFLQKGRSGLIVSGDKEEDIAVTALKLELMLQKVQTQFLKEEVEELRKAAQSKVKMERNPEARDDPQLKPFIQQLEMCRLQIQKVERVENPALEKVFKIQKGQMTSHSERLLQLVSAQFCDMVSHIGFRPECAPPDDSSLGEGLYFAEDVQTALRAWTRSTDRFLYLFVAEVLKGKSGRGKPGLVLAPGRDSGAGAEPTTRYDSVEGSGLTVIFNHHQALPKFIITCRRETDVSFL